MWLKYLRYQLSLLPFVIFFGLVKCHTISFAHQFINTLSRDYNKEQPLLLNVRLLFDKTTIAHENDQNDHIITIFLKKDFFLINYFTELKFRSILVDYN